jgi:hypothetical protein
MLPALWERDAVTVALITVVNTNGVRADKMTTYSLVMIDTLFGFNNASCMN